MPRGTLKTIESYNDLKGYCLSQLGAPVIGIEVADEQIEDCIHDALEYYYDFHHEGTELVHLAKQLTADDFTSDTGRTILNTGTRLEVERSGEIKIPLDDSIVSVVRVLKFGNLGNYSSFFRQALIQDLYTNTVRIGDVTSYYLLRLRLADWNEFFSSEPEVKHRRYQNFMTVDMGFQPRIGDWVVIEAYRKILPYEPPETINLISGVFRGFSSTGKIKFRIDQINDIIPLDTFLIKDMIDHRDDFVGVFDAVDEDDDGNPIDIPEKGQFKIDQDSNGIYCMRVGNHAEIAKIVVGESIRMEFPAVGDAADYHIVLKIISRTIRTSSTLFFGNVLEGKDIEVPITATGVMLYLQDDFRDGFHTKIKQNNLEEFHEIYGGYAIDSPLYLRTWILSSGLPRTTGGGGLFIDDDNVWYLLSNIFSETSRYIYVSYNQGATWEENDRIALPDSSSISSADFTDNTGLAIRGNYILFMNNNRLWRRLGTSWSRSNEISIDDRDVDDDITGLAVDEEGIVYFLYSYDNKIYTTTAALGSDIELEEYLDLPDDVEDPQGLSFLINGHLVLLDNGDESDPRYYIYNGEEWSDPIDIPFSTARGIAADSENTVYVVGMDNLGIHSIYEHKYELSNFSTLRNNFKNKEDNEELEMQLRIFPRNVDVQNLLAHVFEEDITEVVITMDYHLLNDLGIGWNRNTERTIFPDGDDYGYRSVWNDRFIREYATQLIKRQWGLNTKKYGDFQLPGGVTFNGSQIYDEASTRITEMRDQMLAQHAGPVRAFYG